MLGKSGTSEEKYGARGMTNFIALRQSAFKPSEVGSTAASTWGC